MQSREGLGLTAIGPIILGCTGEAAKDNWPDLPRHREEGQVKLDVDRAFNYYPDRTARPISTKALLTTPRG